MSPATSRMAVGEPDVAATARVTGLDAYDVLEERLRSVRELIGITSDEVRRPAAPVRHEQVEQVEQVAPVRAVPPGDGVLGAPRAEAVSALRFPRIGWDLVLLAGAWAGLLVLVVSLLA